MVLNLKRHTRIQFDEDLEGALELIRKMGQLVEQQLRDAIALFRIENKTEVAEKAEVIIAKDAKVNKLELSITDACLYLIAKHQPKANDLRLVFAILRASSEFERIGDTVSKICDTARNAEHVINSLIEQIEHFAEHTLAMLHSSLEALVNMDLSAATEAYFQHHYHREYKSVLRALVDEAKANPDHLIEYFRANVTIRQIERIGDRCRNINEFVYFYAKGVTPDRADIEKEHERLHGVAPR